MLIASIVVFIILLSLFISFAKKSSNAVKNNKYRVDLYTNAYAVLLEYLSDADMLPPFDEIALVEESINGGLDKEDLRILVKELNDIYPYSITISQDHDRYESLRTEQTVNENGIAYIYFFLPSDRLYSGFNKVKIEGMVNNSNYQVIMFFRFRNNSWKLLEAEVLPFP